MCSVLYLAVHNKTCTGQLISHLTTCPHCDVTGGRSITWGSISVSKLVYIIDFLSPAARFRGMRVKLLWMRVRVSVMSNACVTLLMGVSWQVCNTSTSTHTNTNTNTKLTLAVTAQPAIMSLSCLRPCKKAYA